MSLLSRFLSAFLATVAVFTAGQLSTSSARQDISRQIFGVGHANRAIAEQRPGAPSFQNFARPRRSTKSTSPSFDVLQRTIDDAIDLDPAPYSRMTRNFMRFGRRASPTGNDDVVCFPAPGEAEDVDGEQTTGVTRNGESDLEQKRGDEKRFDRTERSDQQYDYNGKPFMRFGKRFMRFGKAGPGREAANVVCYPALASTANDDGGEKRFMRFGRSYGSGSVQAGTNNDDEIYSDLRRLFGSKLV